MPVLAEVAVGFLECSPGKVVLDATIGAGGHAELILSRLGENGRLIGVDWDERALEIARKRLGSRPNLSLVRDNFRNLAVVLARMGVAGIDALLLDLGLSSIQIEEADRGFSFKSEGPLDMRMDNRLKNTAADIVNTYSEQQITRILREFGEEPNARRIAKELVAERTRAPIRTTTQLAEIVRRRIPRKTWRPGIDPATRTFQALRIEVNSELDNLKLALNDGINLLKPRGRVCVISFHSLEDRIVKQMFAQAARGCVCPQDVPQCVCGKKPSLRILTRKPIGPSDEEVAGNPRARSARLRAAEKLGVETSE
ncbi:16S rRNA (cytosine(1402)-N(4))-methyltransferase RsmH [Candidatus Poribacteria bacterium]|nr:16S rRNA (cytosine(1402)-N(4))-methyltransferase RsmH [Candidatus Poribacteria bacterium]